MQKGGRADARCVCAGRVDVADWNESWVWKSKMPDDGAELGGEFGEKGEC